MGQDERRNMQFLPGLQNDVVLTEIVPKLLWRDFHTLSSVSPCWRDAIQSRLVYKERVGSKSAETLVVLCYDWKNWVRNLNVSPNRHAICLYSMRDDSWHQLPDFPVSEKGIPHAFQCIAFDGKLYGFFSHKGVPSFIPLKDSPQVHHEPIRAGGKSEVYVLDLVGQSGWRKCADMPKPKLRFACSVLDGKVFVFGGESYRLSPAGTNLLVDSNESFVYDPKANSWSSIAPMILDRCYHHAITAGDKLWVHGGDFGMGPGAHFAMVYHPDKDKWDSVRQERCHESESLFTVGGRPYLMTPLGIYAQEESSKSKTWRHVHSFSFPNIDAEDLYELEIIATQAVEGEVLTLFGWFPVLEHHINHIRLGQYVQVLTRSKGFGTEKKDIELKVVKCMILPEDQLWYPSSISSIEL